MPPVISKLLNAAKVGQLAPNGALTEVSGATIQIWFVTTWCSSCKAGTQVMDNLIL